MLFTIGNKEYMKWWISFFLVTTIINILQKIFQVSQSIKKSLCDKPFQVALPPAESQQEPLQQEECLHWRHCRCLHESQIYKWRGCVRETGMGFLVGGTCRDNKLETPDCEHCARISLAVILQLTIAIIVIILPLKRFLCSIRTK